jgi:hypothetical protein
MQCNLILGHVKDDPGLLRKLADYLESADVGQNTEFNTDECGERTEP